MRTTTWLLVLTSSSPPFWTTASLGPTSFSPASCFATSWCDASTAFSTTPTTPRLWSSRGPRSRSFCHRTSGSPSGPSRNRKRRRGQPQAASRRRVRRRLDPRSSIPLPPHSHCRPKRIQGRRGEMSRLLSSSLIVKTTTIKNCHVVAHLLHQQQERRRKRHLSEAPSRRR